MRFVPLPSSLQSIKTYDQIDRYFKEASSYFSPNDTDTIKYFSNYDIFMFLDRKNLAAFLITNMEKCYSISSRKIFDFVSFYFCTVPDSYRGRGLSYKIIDETVRYLKKTCDLKDDTVLALHVSPKDEMMPVAAKVYYSMGFRRGIFVESSPLEMVYQIDTLFEKSKDLIEVVDDEEKAYGKGYYFMMYCRLKDFNKFRAASNEILGEKTRRLFEMMKRRLDNQIKMS